MTPVRELVGRARQLPPRAVPGAATRYALRAVRARARRWAVLRARGELPDRALLRATAHAESPPLATARTALSGTATPSTGPSTGSAVPPP